ncbi:MAG TPA: STAS domain-containing protein [Acidimicrobiia bacterium]|jgi:anti-sigma B factor antagonist
MTSEPGGDTGATPLTLERSGTEQDPVISARGEIDVATSPLLRSELTSVLAHEPERVTLDLDGVTFIDSSGLGVLVGALKRLREAGGEHFTVVNAQDSVRKVFDITGLSPLFELPEL